MTDSLTLSTAFMLGILGSSHCMSMCGGIAASLSLSQAKDRIFFITLVYNLGRIMSYSIAGALIGSLSWLVQNQQHLIILRTFSSLMLIALGLYIAQWWRGLVHIEAAGKFITPYLRPLANRLLPVHTFKQALFLGMVWGWLPCGLVYSSLIWASAANDWKMSALLMLMFGSGTLMSMMLVGTLATQTKAFLKQKRVRQLCGSTIILFGIFSLPW